MSNLTITREQCVQAIQTEPLGLFGDFMDRNEYSANDPDCKVCAVGAIMHAVIGATKRRQYCLLGQLNVRSPIDAEVLAAADYTTAADLTADKLRSGELEPLSALSSLYEFHAGEKVNIEKVRRRLAAFVATEFPPSIDVEVLESE